MAAVSLPRSEWRHWLRKQGYTGAITIEKNCIFVRTAGDADDMTTLLNQNWCFDNPQPEVGYMYEDEEDDE